MTQARSEPREPAVQRPSSRGRSSSGRFGAAPLLAIAAFVTTLAVQLILLISSPANVGLMIVVLALGTALVFAGLGSPTLAVALFLVAAFLRLALPQAGLPFDPFVLAFAGVILAAGVAIARRVNQLPRLGAVEAVMVLYLTWNIVSALAPHRYPASVPDTGEDFAVWRFLLTGALLPFALYVVGRFVFDRDSSVRRLLWIVLALAAYSAVVSVAQFFGPAALVWPRYIVDGADWPGRAAGVFDQPVQNGLLLVLGFVIALLLAGQVSEPRWRRVAAGAVAVAAIPAIYLTHTRVVWLVFGLVLVAGSLWARNFRTGFVATLVAVCLAIGVGWSTFTSDDRTRGGIGSVSEVDSRLNIIATSLWAIGEKPIAGWGVGRFNQLNTYHHKQWSPGIDWKLGYGLSSHHNELGIAAELGLVGLVLWLTILALVLWRLVKAVRRLPSDGIRSHGLAVVALLAFLSWLVVGATVELRFFEFSNGLVWLLAGIAVGCAERAHPAERAPPAERTQPVEQVRG
ncbi:MAG: O-antigen ligase family protein [Pseudonocardiaceae bacterium]